MTGGPLPQLFRNPLFRRLSMLLPLRAVLQMLSSASRFAPQGLKPTEATARALRLDKRASRAFSAGLRKAYFYNEIVKHYLLEGRPDIIAPLFDSCDMSPIGRCHEKGKGLFLAGSHTGPKWAAAHALRINGLDPVVITWNPPMLPERFRSSLRRGEMTIGDVNRHLFIMAFAALRRGGIVFAAPDGAMGSHVREWEFMGQTVRVDTALSALARIAGAVCLPFAVVWDGMTLRTDFGGGPITTPDDAADAETVWMSQYLAWNDSLLRSDPVHWRLGTGIVSSLLTS